MEQIDIILIGKYIRSLRLSKGWSQAKVERITGLSASSISNIEHGNKGLSYNISLPSLVKIAHAFGISLFDLLSYSGYLIAIGDEKYESDKSEIIIKNHTLVHYYRRLPPRLQQNFADKLTALAEESDDTNQQQMFKKKP